MRYQVPQFIEVEDKIFGPLTLKQFIYIIGGGAIVFLLYIFIPIFFIFILLAIPVAALSVGLAFFKVNGKPFISVLENGYRYLVKNKIYTWKKREQEVKHQKQQKEEILSPVEQVSAPDLTKEKLSDLTWSLNTKQNIKKKNN